MITRLYIAKLTCFDFDLIVYRQGMYEDANKVFHNVTITYRGSLVQKMLGLTLTESLDTVLCV